MGFNVYRATVQSQFASIFRAPQYIMLLLLVVVYLVD